MSVRGTYELAVDWDADGDYTSTGDDITSRTLKVEFFRGRDYASQLLGRSVTGQLTAVLNNDSGDYNSFNSSSPLYGNIKPGRKVRLRGGSGAADTVLWTGFLQRLIPMPSRHTGNVAVLTAVGPLAYMNDYKTHTAMYTSLATGTAVGYVLDDASWPAGLRAIDTGQTTMNRWWSDEEAVIAALRQIEATEAGFIWESKDAEVVFEDRYHRLVAPHTVSQATFSDAPAAALVYNAVEQEDPLPGIFNYFSAQVQRYTVGVEAVLWTCADVGTNSPSIAPGESWNFVASYSSGVDAWTTPVATTDYTANSAADGSGSDLTGDVSVSATKSAERMAILLTNSSTSIAYITLLQARGTPLTASNPLFVREEDTTSQDSYGLRTYPSPGEFIPSAQEALNWCLLNVGTYKDPIPILKIVVNGNRDASHLTQVLTRDISDRITIVADNNTELGISQDFFIEAVSHIITDGGMYHNVTYECSPVGGYTGFWVVGVSRLDYETRLAY